MTPKHILLPWAIKTLTGNVELIRTMNRLGHGCSYIRLEEIDTALCIEKLESVQGGGVPLPSSIHPSVPTVLAFDNIDRLEELLSGAGTSHRVNGIIVQPISSSCAHHHQSHLRTRKARSEQYNHWKYPFQYMCNGYRIWINKTNTPDYLIPFIGLYEPWGASHESWHLSRV